MEHAVVLGNTHVHAACGMGNRMGGSCGPRYTVTCTSAKTGALEASCLHRKQQLVLDGQAGGKP